MRGTGDAPGRQLPRCEVKRDSRQKAHHGLRLRGSANGSVIGIPAVRSTHTCDTAATAVCMSGGEPTARNTRQPPPSSTNPAANRPGSPTNANSSAHDQHQKNRTGSAAPDTSATCGISIASFGQRHRTTERLQSQTRDCPDRCRRNSNPHLTTPLPPVKASRGCVHFPLADSHRFPPSRCLVGQQKRDAGRAVLPINTNTRRQRANTMNRRHQVAEDVACR